jgi:methylglyoxal synthase
MNQIALIAHDRVKPELATFIKEREEWLWGKELIATGRTADHMEAADFSVPIKHLSQGRRGGYLEIVEKLKNGEVKMVFFFRDPEVREADHPDIAELVKTVMEENIPMASNPASAELLILGQIKMDSARKS